MRKIIAAMNMTLDGVCDHTSGIPDEEIHDHYRDLLKNGDVALYGRITYQLMEYWMPLVTNPTGDKSMDEFAVAIDRIPKVVFSQTLKTVEWETARISERGLEEEVLSLRQQPGGNILVGSRSLIITLINLGLVDEFQILIYPVIEGKGLPLFDKIHDRTVMKLVNTKTFAAGAVMLYYEFPKS